jgi:tetratricopeptide (TPR) repeat protein
MKDGSNWRDGATRWAILVLFLLSIPLVQKSFAQQLKDLPQSNGSFGSLSGTDQDTTRVQLCLLFTQQSEASIKKKDYAAAAEVLGRAVTVCQNRTDTLLKLSRVQMLSSQFAAAQATIDQLLQSDPHNADALMTEGEVAYLMNDDSKAESAFKQAILATPKDPEPHYLLGRLYMQYQNLSQAQQEFQTSLSLNPAWYKPYDGLGVCYEADGNNEDAVRTFMDGVARLYKDPVAGGDVLYADFAELLLKLNSNDKAFDLAAEAASQNPTSARNYLLAGRALEQAGAWSRSVVWLQRSAALNPKYPDPHYFLSRAYRRLGNHDAAQQERQIFEDLSAKAPTIQR